MVGVGAFVLHPQYIDDHELTITKAYTIDPYRPKIVSLFISHLWRQVLLARRKGGQSQEKVSTDMLSDGTTPMSTSVWHRVADSPAYWSTCAAVGGELLAVGGSDEIDTPTKLMPFTWNLINNMPPPRRRSCRTPPNQ